MSEEELANIFISQVKAIKYRLPRKHMIGLLSRILKILNAVEAYLIKGEDNDL